MGALSLRQGCASAVLGGSVAGLHHYTMLKCCGEASHGSQALRSSSTVKERGPATFQQGWAQVKALRPTGVLTRPHTDLEDPRMHPGWPQLSSQGHDQRPLPRRRPFTQVFTSSILGRTLQPPGPCRFAFALLVVDLGAHAGAVPASVQAARAGNSFGWGDG